MRSKTRSANWSALVALALLVMAIAWPASGQSSNADGVALGRGEAAPFDGILLSREAFDELVAEAEANEIRRSQMEAARALIDAYKARIEELEGSVSRRGWVNRACGLAVGVLGGLYAHQLGRNSGLPPDH